MNRVTITLHIDLPEGVVPDVAYATIEPQELAPLPSTPPADMFAEAKRVFGDVAVRPAPSTGPSCPSHGAMTRFPAGTNKAGKPYNASWRCSVKDCATKPIWDRDAA